MTRQNNAHGPDIAKVSRRRPHETGGPHDYGGNPDLEAEANEPGDRVQGSDRKPVTGKP
jgi:hypothetical protein